MKLIVQSIKDYFKSKKDRGLEPVFFEKIADQNTSRDQIKKNLVKLLESKGFKYTGKKFSEEHKRNISLAKKGKEKKILS